ncbi:MAG: histidinol dehydrogenase, partial [Pacificimonas sp.]
MVLRLDAGDAEFAARFAEFVEARREEDADVTDVVRDILAEVREDGDAALERLTQRFDRISLADMGLRIGDDEIEAAVAGIEPDLKAALDLAADRIRAFHEAQRPVGHEQVDADGNRTGWRYTAVEAAGIYIPGGRATYPSSVLMNAIPAKVAGVDRLVMATPTPDGRLNPLVLAAARLAGVDEIYRIGGAQAVAALAFGTASVSPVDVITGPGNAFVAEAKRQLYGRVGIDMVAGPSEILIVADEGASADVVAADLLSQAEHDPSAQSILITNAPTFADEVEAALPAAFAEIATRDAAMASWAAHGAIFTVTDLADAVPLIDRLAPEHLALAVAEPQPLFDAVRHAGSIFMGYRTPEASGDYVAGPNHTLPTGRRARFAGGLGTMDFMKRTTFLDCSETGLAAIGPAAARLADAEGLPAHAMSVRRR